MVKLYCFWLIVSVIATTVCAGDFARLLNNEVTESASILSGADDETLKPCFDPVGGNWYTHGETKEGGAGCGGCTCLNGHWQCSSCGKGTLVCPRINCDETCKAAYEVRKDDHGCRYCRCFPKGYCLEVCGLCTNSMYSAYIKCPKSCSC